MKYAAQRSLRTAETSRWCTYHHICTHSKIKQTWLYSIWMNEPHIVVHVQYWTVHQGYMMMHREKNRGRGSGLEEEMGKEGARGTRGPKQGERDSKPIIIGLEKAFHPKTVTAHANIHTSICLAPAYKYSIHTHTHTVRHLSLSLTHTHIRSCLQTNALLIKYWGVPVANQAEIQFLPSLMELPVCGRRRKKRRERSGLRNRHKGKRRMKRSGESEGREEEGWERDEKPAGPRWKDRKGETEHEQEDGAEPDGGKMRPAILKWTRNYNTIWQIRPSLKEQNARTVKELTLFCNCTDL